MRILGGLVLLLAMGTAGAAPVQMTVFGAQAQVSWDTALEEPLYAICCDVISLAVATPNAPATRQYGSTESNANGSITGGGSYTTSISNSTVGDVTTVAGQLDMNAWASIDGDLHNSTAVGYVFLMNLMVQIDVTEPVYFTSGTYSLSGPGGIRAPGSLLAPGSYSVSYGSLSSFRTANLRANEAWESYTDSLTKVFSFTFTTPAQVPVPGTLALALFGLVFVFRSRARSLSRS